MPFNMVGFTEATPGTGIVPIAPGGDERLYTVAADDLKITKEARFILGVFYAATTTPARVILRQPKMIDYDIIKGCLITERAASRGFTDLFATPLPLRVDKLNVLSVNATDEETLVGLLLGSGKITQAMKDEVNPTHVIHGYSDTTIDALTWSHCPITWNEELDAGIYEIVKMRASVFLAAAPWSALVRLSIPGAQSWKPGVVAHISGGDHTLYSQEEIGLGQKWPRMGIKFDTDHMPNIEVLSPAAHTDQNIELTLQKVE